MYNTQSAERIGKGESADYRCPDQDNDQKFLHQIQRFGALLDSVQKSINDDNSDALTNIVSGNISREIECSIRAIDTLVESLEYKLMSAVGTLQKRAARLRDLRDKINWQKLDLQSDDVSDTQHAELIMSNRSQEETNLQQENLQFLDNHPGLDINLGPNVDYTKGDDSQSVELGDFLSRPVLIRTRGWSEGGGYFTPDEFYPWFDYFSNPAIKRKLENYYLLKCNLHIKVVVNASPFYYGAGIIAYQPLWEYEQNWDFSTNPNYFDFTLLSQKPHIMIYPQTSQAGSLELPYVWHKEWLDVTSADELRGMGRMAFRTYTNLLNANGTTGTGVSLSIYAYATDVRLAGPTAELSLQAGDVPNDEYKSDGVVSAPASAIARYAGYLKEVPVIGPFATATQMVASAIGNAASIFGYTRVPNVEDVAAYQTKTHPNLAATDIGAPIEKLTLDAKNELTIDPKVCGVNLSDENMISSFVQREAYIGEFDWDNLAVSGNPLQVIRISPNIKRYTASTSNQQTVFFTPMAYIAQMFSYWRGDIIIRMKIICSQYHRGRLEVIWDPAGNMNVAADLSMTNYTKVIDVDSGTDFEFRVPYTQPTAYSESRVEATTINTIYTSSTTLFVEKEVDNGALLVRVLNRQTSPVAAAPIKVLMFARGAENLEFAGPREIPNNYSPYQIQSDDLSEDEFELQASETSIAPMVAQLDMGIKPSSAPDNINLIYMGESVSSLRTIMQRSMPYVLFPPGQPDSVNNFFQMEATQQRMPAFPGYVVGGFFLANNVNGPGTSPYNFVNWCYLNWLSLAFIGNRGSIVYWANPMVPGNKKPYELSISRNSFPIINIISPSAQNHTNIHEYAANASSFNLRECSGLALTNTVTQTGISASVPMYSKYKMHPNNPDVRSFITGPAVEGDGITIALRYDKGVDAQGAVPGAQMYVAAGADFSLIFFSGLQPIYRYNAPILPA